MSFWRVYRKLINYIEEEKLFDPKDKDYFTPDSRLATIFGTKRIPVDNIDNKIKKHLTRIR